MARRTKCTPEVTDRVCQVLRAGNYIRVACEYAGISEACYYNWTKRAREELERVNQDPRRSVLKKEKPFVEFLEAVTHARRAAEIECVAHIKKAAKKDWRAASWYLEHAHTERWGKKRVDVTTDGKSLTADPLAGMTKDEKRKALKKRLRQLEATDAAPDDIKGLPGDE